MLMDGTPREQRARACDTEPSGSEVEGFTHEPKPTLPAIWKELLQFVPMISPM